MPVYEYNHPSEKKTPPSAEVVKTLKQADIDVKSVQEDNRLNRTLVKTTDELDDEEKEAMDEAIQDLVKKDR